MIEKIWSGESPLWRLLLPLSWLYGLVSGAIRLCYKLKLKRAWRAPVPVVVVGNLTAGGNGKTPVVVWLVEQLQQRGIRVGVVSRGYGGKAESYPLLLSADTTTAQAGDEPVLIYQRTDAPVAVSPVRSDAVKAILAQHPDVQIIVTDDGLKSVDAVIVNGGVPRSGEIPMHLLPGQAVNLRTGTRCDVAQLEHVVAMAGIGHPPRFFATLKMCGVQPEKCVPLADHQSLNHADVSALVSAGQTLVMTEKDAVKCRAFAEENWWYLPIDAQLSGDEPAKLLTQLTLLASGN